MAVAAGLIAAALSVVAGCGGQGQASPPVVTQTVAVGPPSSEPAFTPTEEPSVGPGTDPGTVESRAAACRALLARWSEDQRDDEGQRFGSRELIRANNWPARSIVSWSIFGASSACSRRRTAAGL